MKKTTLQKIKAKRALYSMILKSPSHATLNTNSGIATFKSDGVPKMIEINYSGRLYIYNRLPDGYFISNSSNTIKIINLLGRRINEDGIIFKYLGIFNALSVSVYSFQNSRIKGTIQNDDITASVDKQETNLEDDTTIIGQDGSVARFVPPSKPILGKNIDDDTINGLYTTNKFTNGYSGYYNISPSTRTFMTGKKTTASSKPILNESLLQTRADKHSKILNTSKNLARKINNLGLRDDKEKTEKMISESNIKSIPQSIKTMKRKGGKY